MLKKMKPYQFFFISFMIIIWSGFSYKANATKYFDGYFREATVTQVLFDPDAETDYMATFEFKDINKIISRSVDKNVFTAFHSHGQKPIDIQYWISDQELELPANPMMSVAKWTACIAFIISLICFITMIVNSKKKNTAEEKRQKLKSRV